MMVERNQEKQRADQLYLENLQEKQRANELYLQKLLLEKELLQLKKLYCGPRADQLQSEQDLAQMLLEFAQQLDQKAIHPQDLPSQPQPDYEVRRVQRRKGRRALANFENLPVTTHVYELSGEERNCPGCGRERKEIGEEKSWQVEYIPGHFERLEHVRKKYACPGCEQQGEPAQLRSQPSPKPPSRKAWQDQDCWPSSSPASSLTICPCTGWKISLSDKG